MINTATLPHKNTTIWLVGVSFLLFQFFLQLSSGIVIGAIMQEQQFSALTAGLLSSAFYYVYTAFQIPVGILFDRYNTKTLLYINAFICALGCFIFGSSQNLILLFLGRLTIGAGSAFAFIGLSHLLRQHFPLRNYAFMIGLSETLGFTMAVVGMIGMGAFIDLLGWQAFINSAGFLGMCIALFCFYFIPNHRFEPGSEHQYKKQLLIILKNKLTWLNGFFVGLEFSIITVFASLWAEPFIELKLKCGVDKASLLTSMILLGAGLSCPVFGHLSVIFSKRKPLIQASCWSSALLFLIILYAPIHSPLLLGCLLFLLGLCCGAYMLAYSIANELAPTSALSTCTGFTNTLAMLFAPLLQPLVGYLLDTLATSPDNYTLSNYQTALLVIPVAVIGASMAANFLPEK